MRPIFVSSARPNLDHTLQLLYRQEDRWCGKLLPFLVFMEFTNYV